MTAATGRRAVLAGAALWAGGALVPARAQAWPDRPIRLVVPYAPGGSTDIIGRLVAQELGPLLPQPVIVENRAGAASAVGSQLVARAAPDGTTLLLGTATLCIDRTLRPNLGYDVTRDFAPVANLIDGAFLVLVNAEKGPRDLPALLDDARARPGAVTYGSPGTGTANHIAGASLAAAAGVRMTHVSYRGEGPGVTAVAAGEIDVMFGTYGAAAPLLQAGKVRALAVTGAARMAPAPAIPTVAEAALPGFSAGFWNGVLAPAQTPEEIVRRLNLALNAALRSPALRRRLDEFAYAPVGGDPASFAARIRRDIDGFGQVIRVAGITAEE